MEGLTVEDQAISGDVNLGTVGIDLANLNAEVVESCKCQILSKIRENTRHLVGAVDALPWEGGDDHLD